MAQEIFIGYSRKNLERVKAIKAGIERATHLTCWMDMQEIVSGRDFVDSIIEGIENCKVVLRWIVMDENYVKYAVWLTREEKQLNCFL